MLQIPEWIQEEIKAYPDKLQDYLDGKIEDERFKPYRVGLGVYEQRDEGAFMVRSRVPSGNMTLKQLNLVAELANRYSHGRVHLTTRGDVQFHEVDIEDTKTLLMELFKEGIMTRGTGGNTVRNVVCSALSGVDINEAFDVSQDAESVTKYLLEDPTSLRLPRKYKIVFSNSKEDTGNVTFADLGFLAKVQDGRLGYEVYVAGGLGNKPAASIELTPFIAREEVLYYAKGLKNLFEAEGDRSNKNRARIRFIRYRLGDEGFKERLNEEIAKVHETEELDLGPLVSQVIEHPGIEKSINSPLVREQKQKGLYSLYIHPESGNLWIKDLKPLLDYLNSLDYETSLRFTNTQGFYIRDLQGPDAEKILKLASFVSSSAIDHSLACAGASTCKLGLCLSQNFLHAIIDRFQDVDADIKDQLPRIHISGCPNSCGQHQIGRLGFAGKAKRTSRGLVPHYSLFLNNNTESKPQLGQALGDIPAKNIPDFLYELAMIKRDSGIKDFNVFTKKRLVDIEDLIRKWTMFDEDDSKFYKDFGKDEPFSLKGRGPGECSSGVMDVIRFDLGHGDDAIKSYEKSQDDKDLYEAGLAFSRALLVLRGVDSVKERVIFNAFVKEFVEEGWVKSSIGEVIETFLDYKMGDVDSLESVKEDVYYLQKRIHSLYDSLDAKLAFTLEREEEASKDEPEKKEDINLKEEDSSTNYKIVDFKGVACPMNFVKVKIELSKVPSKTTVGFYLDDGAPIKNVPESVSKEGHEIVEIDKDYEGYNLLVVRKK